MKRVNRNIIKYYNVYQWENKEFELSNIVAVQMELSNSTLENEIL